MATGPGHGVLHHPVHGQDHFRNCPAQPRLQRVEGAWHQEQGGPGENQEEDQGAQVTQREGEEGYGEEGRGSCGS